MMMPVSIALADKEVQDHYTRMIKDGQTPAFAEMCALGVPPGTKGTDRAFQQGRLDGNWMDGMPVHQAQKMVREAKASGISISGKQYISGLADKRGHMDPMAWVSDTADVRAVAKARNLTVQGMVNHQGDEMPRKVTAISKRAAEKLAREEMKNRPGLKKGDALALVREKYSLKGKRKAQ
jgi:hypothetical protein